MDINPNLFERLIVHDYTPKIGFFLRRRNQYRYIRVKKFDGNITLVFEKNSHCDYRGRGTKINRQFYRVGRIDDSKLIINIDWHEKIENLLKYLKL